MAAYRQIHITFWQDPFIEELTPKQKYFYIYLMTNSKTKQCGCYEISMKLIRYETGLTQNEIDSYIKLLVDSKKIDFNKSNQEFLILNWLKHNSFKSPKVKTCIVKELDVIKTTAFVDYVLCILGGETTINSLSIDYLYTNDSSLQKEKEKEETKELEEEKKKNEQHEEAIKINLTFDINKIWEAYPIKKGKTDSFKKIPKILDTITKKELLLCIIRYDNEVEDKQYMVHGSTFFNGRYEDYLDKNYQKPIKTSIKSHTKNANNRFQNFEGELNNKTDDDIESKMKEKARKRHEEKNS